MDSSRAAKSSRRRAEFTMDWKRSLRQAAEHRAFDNPSLPQHVADFAVARRIAVVGLSAFAVVVKTNHGNTIGRTVVVDGRVGVECEPLVGPEPIRLHELALVVIDREEMRVRADAGRAEKAAGVQAARI